MSSRLFQRIREERGLVYGIHCFNAAYADGGLFGIYAGTGEDDLAELVPAVCEEFVGVADTLTEQELVRARNQIKAGTLMALESSGARCEQAARHLLDPRPADPLCRDRRPHRGGRSGRRAPRRAPPAAGQAHPRGAGADRRTGIARQDRRAPGGVTLGARHCTRRNLRAKWRVSSSRRDRATGVARPSYERSTFAGDVVWLAMLIRPFETWAATMPAAARRWRRARRRPSPRRYGG